MRNTFEQEGSVRGTDLLAGLVGLWREGASGSLQFSRSGATAGFELARGELVASSSSDPRFETAAILVRAGKLEAATLERIAAPEGGDRALLALQAGVLTRREWRWGEKIRAVEILSDLLTWLDGEYWFFRSTEDEAPEARLPIPRLILELFLRSRDRSLVLQYLGGVDVPIARADTFEEEFATFGLTADAESVVRLIDGKSSAAEIASEAPAEPFAVEKLLAALVTLGLVHPEFAPGTARPAAVPAEERGEGEEDEERARDGETHEPAEAERVAPPDREEPESGPRELEPEGASYLDSALNRAEEPEVEEPGFRDPEIEEEVAVPAMTDAEFDGGTIVEDFGTPPPEEAGEDRDRFGDLAPDPAQFEAGLERPLDSTTGVGSLERPRQRSGSPLLWTLGILALLVAGLVWLRSRGPSSPESVAAAIARTATAAPEPVPTEEPALAAVPTFSAPATAVPTVAAAMPTRPAPTPVARTEKPAKVRSPIPAPAVAAGPPPAASASSGTRQYWLDRATRDEKRFGGSKKKYAIQLELACEVTSLVDAFQHDRGGNMWVVTTPYEGKTCFRVLWGHYSTPEAGHRALSSAPGFFSTPKNHPAVTAVR
ncbi:MAG TPA: hypothetical protein VMT25_07240 [Thermoanaerobaculia bacterium]|nr:hypothetical protein [Thermoanaerobaculia bacterium]